ncbi:unnamed protein product [Owenia fusiformis]|uniref:Uncharacterized protein n=1 Tax=Owenia fusiformis TaxID=6347 RepID=A0A8J1XRQ7_OWEFU|nr:unnamed protein product [Owenia fusiformis]
MANKISFFVICTILCGISAVLGQLTHRKFEYKLSFKGPHLVQKDGTIPFWEHGGHAIASDESIRITPSLRSKKGYVWGKNKLTSESWEVEMTFRVTGRGRLGADGLAFWYTSQKGEEGPVFGSSDMWNGLAVFFDSFDNDAQHNNPYIMAMTNDGTKQYDHQTDGSAQQLGGCLRDFRNKPFPVRAKIEYHKKALTLFFHNGMTNNREDYELCLRAENVYLPAEGYLGVSAATGGLADDHDVLSILTHTLNEPSAPGAPGSVPEEERRKFEQEFNEYRDKLERAKDDYRKEHPDAKTDDTEDEDKWYESQQQRELKQIFDGQNMIHTVIRDLNRKIDEVIGRQERTISQISMINSGNTGQVVQQPPAGGNQGGQAYVDTIKRHEVETVIQNGRDILNTARDLKAMVNSVSQKVGQGGAAPPSGYENQASQHEVRDSLVNLQNDIKHLINKPAAVPVCPVIETPKCVSSTLLLVFLAVQTVIFIGYMAYKSSKEAAAKKFY